jgi:hypothetical protein
LGSISKLRIASADTPLSPSDGKKRLLYPRNVMAILVQHLPRRYRKSVSGDSRQLVGRRRGEMLCASVMLVLLSLRSRVDVTFCNCSSQTSAFIVCAAASGWMFRRWQRMGDYDRARVWKHYGWLSGLMCFGCCMGAVSYAAWSQFLFSYQRSDYAGKGVALCSPEFFEAIASYSRVSSCHFGHRELHRKRKTLHLTCATLAMLTLLQALRWMIVYGMTYPFTLCSLVLTKLLVLNRLAEFSKLQGRWALFGRLLVGVVLTGNVVGFFGNVASVVYASRAIAVWDDLLAAGNGTQSNAGCKAKESILKYKSESTRFSKAASLHFGFETVMLILVVVAFVIVGAASARRIRTAMNIRKLTQANAMVAVKVADVQSSIRQCVKSQTIAMVDDQASTSALQLQRQIVGTCSVVFVAFVLRACYTVVFGVSSAFQSYDERCLSDNLGGNLGSRCRPCDNVYMLMQIWLLYTPDIYFAITLFAQPVALIVVLWGMTSGQTLDVMRKAEAERRQRAEPS